MNLAVFDIDGTLTDTNQVDALCYVKALKLEFGLEGILDDWSQYTHSTDPGIMNQVFEQTLGRLPRKAEMAAFQECFLALLKTEKEMDPSQFKQIKGAGALLDHLMKRPDWIAAFATGGWEVTARFKLEAAGLPFKGLAFASGDDGVSREDILRTAILRARRMTGVKSFVNVVSLGDGVWDIKAARNLKLNFIGVGNQAKLQKAGAGQVVPDFDDLQTCLELLEQAARLS
jgi:phosphoglycolate phosphatase-like HAD superfamily hydrolase